MSPSLKAHSNYSTVTCVENGWVVHRVRLILFIYLFFHEKGSKVVERESPSLSNAEAPQCPVDFPPLLKVRMCGMCPITPPDLSIHDKSLLKRSAFRMKKKKILGCGATKKMGQSRIIGLENAFNCISPLLLKSLEKQKEKPSDLTISLILRFSF